ncbi:MAG: discoidin domain-containing protein, partial [Planctomycetes bacterium]|nr:discoidin domain-containing protein [Planctomycetota bacterium]
MWKRCTCFVVPVVILALLPGGAAFGALNILKDPALVGWWSFDEGQGAKVADSSPNHRDGTAYQGTLIWEAGMHGSAARLKIPTLVQIPAFNITMTQSTMAGWIKPYGAQAAWASIIMTRGSATGLNMNPDTGTLQMAYHWGDASTTWGYRPGTLLASNEWNFAAVTVEPTRAVFYLNGSQVGVNTAAHGAVNWNAAVFLGGDGSGSYDTRRLTDAALDDVSIWTRALTADEILAIMKGLKTPGAAGNPVPPDEAVDVPQDTALSWTAGPFAATHDVYLGTVFADVNNASRTNPGSVLVSQGQTAVTYQPTALLEFGKTYYWRVDEVNAPPDNTIFKGNVWSFQVEPYGYPVKPVSAKASSFQSGMGPEKTIDGSGLTGDLHGTEPTTMWMSATKPNWIQYEFDKAYMLHELKVWNSNQIIESVLGFGAKGVTVEYSLDGVAWTALSNVPEFGRAPGTPGYAANTTVSFGAVEAKFVKLTINANWGGMIPQSGLAEVRFSYVPVQARAPQPAAGTTGVNVDTDLDWRPGRGATSHTVYFGTDPDAVKNGTAPSKSVTVHGYDVGTLDYGTKYYWKVDEVGTATYPGELWSFTTREFAAVEDFESYTDDEGSRIYETWTDGWTNGSGSVVGHLNAPFAETGTVHSGKQSMPMDYNNAKTPFYSEAQREFAPAQNWTLGGAKDVSLWFHGSPARFLDKGNGAFTVGASGHDIWDNADDFRLVYKQLTGNGSVTVKVESLTNTNAWAKAGVMIRNDLTAGSTMAYMIVSWSSGASFGWRQLADGTCGSQTQTGIT